MKNNRLVRKVTLSIILIFIIVLLLQLFVQNFILTEFYGFIKTKRIEQQFDQMSVSYPNKEAINDFTARSGAVVAEVDFQKLLIDKRFLSQFSQMTVLDQEGREFKLIIQQMVDERGTFINPEFFMAPNEEIIVEGIVLNDNVIYPITLASSDFQLSLGFEELTQLGRDKVVSSTFTFSSQELVSRENNFQSYLYDRLLMEIYNNFMEVALNHTMVGDLNHEFIDAESGVTYVMLGKQTESGSFLLTLFAIENVVEIFTILNDVYFYFFILQMVLAIVLASFLARWITRPMMKLIKQGNDIAELNFETKTGISSNDELGDLSKSLNAISENLSQTIAELEVSRDELAKENIIKEENEQRMRTMLASISHDMKTPLSVIGGFVEILRDGVNDKEPDYYYDVMENEVDHMNALISETLEVTSLESGQYKLNYSQVKPADIIDRVLKRLDEVIESSNHQVRLHLDRSLVVCDPLKMEQVIQNLIVNAIKYSPKGSTISIESSISKQKWTFSIVNSGVSINDDELEHIWDRFYRGDKARSRDKAGHGLGLTIVKNILVLHHATYQLENTIEGVRVQFALEYKKVEDE